MKAIFVSVWDGGVEIRTKCEYNPDTKLVTDIESVEADGLDILDDEYVELPSGEEVRDFVMENDEEEPLSDAEVQHLREIVEQHYTTPEQ